jgi:hypothetical protein
MGIFDLFSKRQKRLRGDVSDVYIYDTIPQSLRVQVVHIWQDTIGNSNEYHDSYRGTYRVYKFIVETLCREYGVFTLPGAEKYGGRNYLSELANFLLQEQETEKVLDTIELSFRAIDRITRDYNHLHRQQASEKADEAIEELNARFQEHAIGFQFADGEIIRVDSKLIHSEVVKPALALLHDKEYAGAQAEFLKAHEHYRHRNDKESLAECLKALESIMKAICDKRKWQYESNATCSTLIQRCLDNELIPTFWTQQFSALRSTLESGVPTARNKLGGHGQGSSIVSVPQHLVAYVLHMTASAIVFLVESERSLP